MNIHDLIRNNDLDDIKKTLSGIVGTEEYNEELLFYSINTTQRFPNQEVTKFLFELEPKWREQDLLYKAMAAYNYGAIKFFIEKQNNIELRHLRALTYNFSEESDQVFDLLLDNYKFNNLENILNLNIELLFLNNLKRYKTFLNKIYQENRNDFMIINDKVEKNTYYAELLKFYHDYKLAMVEKEEIKKEINSNDKNNLAKL